MMWLGLQTAVHKGTLLVGGDMHFYVEIIALCDYIFSPEQSKTPW